MSSDDHSLQEYEEASSSGGSEMESSAEEVNQAIKDRKEEAMALNNTWGRNFYGRNKQNDDVSDTSDDEDELEQAKRLQAIKA